MKALTKATRVIKNLENNNSISTDCQFFMRRLQQNVVQLVPESGQIEDLTDKQAIERLKYVLDKGYKVI